MRVVVVCFLLAGAGVWLGLTLLAEEDDSSSRGEGRPQLAQLEPRDARQLERAALTDRRVREIADEAVVKSTIPWTTEGGAKLRGASIELAVRPRLSLKQEPLPAFITPGPTAPAGTPPLYRTVLYTAHDVSMLRILVEKKNARVVEIVPDGEAAVVTDISVVGPAVPKIYYGTSD